MKLYKHQPFGIDWLASKDRALLADEQGLGKTVMAIMAAKKIDRKHEPVLVLVPAGVLYNWAREWENWNDEDYVQVISKGNQEIDIMADVVITTHGLLIAKHLRKQIVMKMWSLVILDEAHKFKTPNTLRTVAFYGRFNRPTSSVVSCCQRVWLLTGTPTPNDVTELWVHIWGLEPDRLEDKDGKVLSFNRFKHRFCKIRQTPWGPKVIGNRNISDLKSRIKGLILRRLKKNELDLPQIRFEKKVLSPIRLPSGLMKMSDAIDDEMSASEGLVALKNSEDFSRFRRLCGIAKVDPVVEVLQGEFVQDVTKCVIFAHHREVIDAIIEKLGPDNCVKIVGGVNAGTRAERVELFQTDPGIAYAVCNIVAGGVGITLTAADEAIFVEMSPVPGENAQAGDRIHRIGQTRKTRVRFIALAGTVDEKIVDILRFKTKMIKEVLS